MCCGNTEESRRRRGRARTPCAPTIPSCSTGKVRFLVINVLNDYPICMCLIVCMYAGILGRKSFKGGRV